ncbi:winged helix-turn-helix transcriptional regulator [Natronolimnobius sp. AArcel1]|uniref:winged helix-turn-helix domain-containing protein n=1 Tax=Natronolimnobius sp. AArcel1 TaxID=1679093 RepID=UPI0013EDE01E|nr:winged helix-turn-helix domain-containing protein [Natronolimnobius sp. AArcel1]NGM71345.1 winged helix-turn-helix transcriptional regulator [Natronolimnobius sp. AArcel1]
MSRTSNRSNGDVIRDFLSVADLLEEPQLAQLYAYIDQEEEVTVQEMMDALGLAQGTAYTYVNRLVDAGVLEATTDEQPRTYVASDIDLTVTVSDGTREYTITPALIDAVGRRTTDDDIDTYIDRHGIAGLATALTYTVDREQGEVTHRLMARDLDISPLAAEIILQALRPIVHEHFDIEEAGASVADIEDADRDIAGDDA